MSLPELDGARALLRTHMAEEAEGDFPRLRRTPSISILKLLDYMGTLTASGQDSLLDSLSMVNAMRFFPPLLVRDRIMEVANSDPALLSYRAALQSPQFAMGLRYQSLRMRKATMNDPMSVKMMQETRTTLDFTPRDDLPVELVPDPDLSHLKPAKAPLMKKLIGKALRDLMGAKGQRIYSETKYEGSLQGTNLTVWTDFGGMGLQLRYGVSIPDESKKVFVVRVMYEDLWAPGPGWDYITEENAESCIALLCDWIAQIVKLRNQVMAS